MIDAVLHIGLGKCGSSALQQALSQKPVLKSKNIKYKNVKYISIDRHGHLYVGEKLRKKSANSVSEYSVSCHTQDIAKLSKESFATLRKRLINISNNNNTLIVMSCEAWAQQINIFEKHSILKKLRMNAKAICYVRNPVEWINSAWWQWGAWSENDLDTFIEHTLVNNVEKWYENIIAWKQLLGDENVTVKILPKDIVSDFYNFIDIDTTKYEENRNNTSLPGEILRFYQKHRELRRSPHDFSMDFILSSSMNLETGYSKTPWVLSPAKIEEIIERTKDSNKKLMEILDTESREICENNKKWWDATAFSHKEELLESYKEQPLNTKDLDKLLFESLKSIKRLSLENKKLKKKLSEPTLKSN